MTAIATDDVVVGFGDVEVLHGVSLVVERGAWTGLIGPNGAGKSTLIKAICGAVDFGGTIAVAGESVGARNGRRLARRLAYVPQRPVYPAGMTVFDFVLLGRTPHLGLLAAEGREDIAAVWEALSALDLLAFADRDVASLSGGETQRISLARVLAQEPEIVVLDEATASLDVAAQHEVLELIARIREEQGVTILSAIHDLTAAAQFCDRLALLDHGCVVATGTPNEVLTERVLRPVFEPTIRVIDVDGSLVVVSLRDQGGSDG
ncbi:MAG: ABC transporter ATP-binding protein [Acidimicrobiia bacterium]|nr:ABC transporter ATP-binding protein [Acidimicrobiia bacterium]